MFLHFYQPRMNKLYKTKFCINHYSKPLKIKKLRLVRLNKWSLLEGCWLVQQRCFVKESERDFFSFLFNESVLISFFLPTSFFNEVMKLPFCRGLLRANMGKSLFALGRTSLLLMLFEFYYLR